MPTPTSYNYPNKKAVAELFRYGFLFVLTVYLLLLIVVDLPFFAFASNLYLKLRFR